MQSAQRVRAVRLGMLLAIALALGNALVLLWVKWGELEQRTVDVQTRLLYRLRLDTFFEREAHERAVFVGDSLIYGAHLKRTEGARWESRTLPGQAERELRARDGAGASVLNLGINGVLFSDLQCVVRDVIARKPKLLVIGLSPRPFSADFGRGGSESARQFLCPQLRATPLARLTGLASEGFYRFLPAYRYRDLLQFHYLDSTPHAFIVEHVVSRLAANDEEQDPDLAQAMQHMRAAQRLNSIEVSDSHPEARGLHQLLRAVREQSATRVLLFYLREDLEILGPAVDRTRYLASSQRFIDLLKTELAGARRARFIALGPEEFAGEYVDHIHLTARGYARLARTLLQELPP
jgi:lysophospholipase L1-like esterase